MKITLVSLEQIWENKLRNQQRCIRFIKKAASFNSDIIIFPEMTLTGFSMNTSVISENFLCSSTISFFKDQALKNSITIIFGVVFAYSEKATNNLIVISSAGEILANYAKIHLFSFSREDQHYLKGNALSQCIIGNIPFGFAICYDLRFPELYQALSRKSEIIVTIANWPKKRIEHWKTLLKARAIENQSICIGVNRIGTNGNGIDYEKSSFVFDQSGIEILPIKSEIEFDLFEIDTSLVYEYRNKFPVKNDR